MIVLEIAEHCLEKEEGRVKVEPISNGNLRIWLSEEEMSKQERDIGSHLQQVLQAAQTRLKHFGKHILVEYIPVAGGCVALVSARRNPQDNGITVYRIRDVGALFRLAEQWAACLSDGQINAHISLYETDDGYALAVYPAPRLSRLQTGLLREYGTLIGRGEVAVAAVAERGRLLAAGDALGKLLAT